jgi:hypothetical protein
MFTPLRSATSVVAFSVLLGACKSGTESRPPGPPAALAPASDTVRPGFANVTLADPLVVRVTDADGKGVPGTAVAWSVASGSGTLASRQTLTDEGGRARNQWTLGVRAGDQHATAFVVTTAGERFVDFRANVAPGATASILVSPTGAFLAVNESRQFVATRVDTYGNSISDRPVTWSSSAPAVATVDAQSGMVTARAAGSAEIRATSESRVGVTTVNVGSGGSGVDTFDSGSLSAYQQFADVAATWTASGGVLTASGLAQQSHFVRSDVRFRDGFVEAEMDRADEGGLVLRFRDNGNLYLLAIRDNGSLLGGRTVEIFRRVGGQFSLLAPGRFAQWPRGQVRTVRFEAVGTSLRAYVDGVLVNEATDGALMEGGIGMRYHDVPEAAGTDVARYLTLRWNGS